MQNKQITKLLTPSWVTNFIGLAASLLVTAAVVILSQYQSSELRQQIFENQARTPVSVHASAYDSITANVSNNSFLGTLPLLLTWAAVGLVVYFFAASIARSFGEAASLRDQLGYVHSSRAGLLRQSAIHLAVRVLAVLVWFGFIKLSVSVLVPYALAAANIAGSPLELSSIAYAVLAVLVLYADIYGHTILLRLIALKPRLFS